MKSALILAPIALVLSGCQQRQEVAVDKAWVRLAAVPANPSAAYFRLEGGAKPEALTGISSPAVTRTEMHENMNSGGVMSMAPLDHVVVSPGGSVAFAPNGKHVMLYGLKPDVKPGGTIPLTFSFASGRKMTVQTRVVGAAIGAGRLSEARPLTAGEIDLARSVFGDAIDYASVRVVLGKWVFFQPKDVVMSPTGRIHFHPHGTAYSDDFSHAAIGEQGLFIHEMTHIWQYQSGIFLPIRRVPWARYDYKVQPGWGLKKYGLEQQAEIVRHAFLLGRHARFDGAPSLAELEPILPFAPLHPGDHGTA